MNDQDITVVIPYATPLPSRAPVANTRDYRIDFFRGVSLLGITLNHTVVPLSFPQSWRYQFGHWFGFNFADVFVFLSGLVCAFAYGKVFERDGLAGTEWKALKRCGQIYAAALLAFLATLLFMLAISKLPHKVDFLTFDLRPLANSATWGKLLLISGPYKHFSILKFYIILLAIMPLGLALYRVNRWSLLATTVTVWAAINGLVLIHKVSQTWGDGPFGNYFAWQLLFFGGLWIGCEKRAGRLRIRMSAGRVIALAAGLLMIDYFRQMAWIVPRLDDRVHLGPVRVVELLAVILIIGHVIPAQAAFFKEGLADMIRRLGTRSLTIFAASIFLCYAGTHLAAILNVGRGGFLALLLAELTLLILFSNLLDRKALRDTPAEPKPA